MTPMATETGTPALSEESIRRMSEEMGIPIREIRKALGLPIEEDEETRRRRELSAIQVEKASTPREAREAWENAPRESEEQKAAFQKWISLCTTPQEAREAWENALPGSEEKKAAIRKIASFYA